MTYNFDEIIDRQNTNALSEEGYRDFVLRNEPEAILPYAESELIKMWVADMQFATPQVVLEAIKKRLEKRILGYTKVFDPAYFASFAAWAETRYGWHIKPDELVISSGVVPALNSLVELILKPGEEVLFTTPSYGPFKMAAERGQFNWIASDLIYHKGHFSIDFEDFEAKASAQKTKLCIFCSPHNPAGRSWSKEELEKIGEICQRHNLWIISDEVHCDVLRTGNRHLPLAKLFPDYDRLITCMAASKTFNLAGMMISNIIISHPDLKKAWDFKHAGIKNPLSVAATQAAYSFGADWLRALQAYLDENFKVTKLHLEQHLPETYFKIPEATYLAWIDLNYYLPGEADLPLFFAKQAGVILEGGNSMFVGNATGFIRLNLACPRSVLLEGLKRITAAIKS